MDLNTSSEGPQSEQVFSIERSARLGSFSSFFRAASTAASMGTLVNSDSTSKYTADGGYEVG